MYPPGVPGLELGGLSAHRVDSRISIVSTCFCFKVSQHTRVWFPRLATGRVVCLLSLGWVPAWVLKSLLVWSSGPRFCCFHRPPRKRSPALSALSRPEFASTGLARQNRHRNSCRTGFWRPVFQEQGAGSSFFICVLAGVPVRVFLLCFPSADAGSPVFLYFPGKKTPAGPASWEYSDGTSYWQPCHEFT